MTDMVMLFSLLAKARRLPGGLKQYRLDVEARLTPDAIELLGLIIEIVRDGIEAGGIEKVEKPLRDMLEENDDLVREITKQGLFVLMNQITPEEYERAERYLLACSKSA